MKYLLGFLAGGVVATGGYVLDLWLGEREWWRRLR